MKCIIKRRYTN